MSDCVNYPEGERQNECAICGGALEQISPDMTSAYPNLVCWECDVKAETSDGEEPKQGSAYQEKVKAEAEDPGSVNFPANPGDNPVFIDGQKCWRRYRFGGYVTRLDQFDCDDIWEFREKHENP